MSDNLRIWNALGKTDPNHTKGFKRAGGFAGTAVKPIWQTMRLTEHFGPAGTGWGMDEPTFQTVNAGEEILVFCTVGLWYREGETTGRVYGVGGDKVMGKNKYGPFTNDEAFKASYTDALSNAMKQIGVAADIHMGLFDDEKYVREAKREFDQTKVPMGSHPGDFAEEAKRDGLTTGDGRSTYQITAAANAKKWADVAIQALNFAQTVADLDAWAEDKKNAAYLVRLEESYPDQHQRVMDALDNARLSLRDRAA